MATCPDCTFVEAQVKEDNRFEIIDIGTHVRHLKEFLKLRDTNPAFAEARANGSVGIPCFVLDDGTVTLSPEKVGLKSRMPEGSYCSIDGKGC